jgi:3',5'-cyclic AMP phosphodiesterase CpdA
MRQILQVSDVHFGPPHQAEVSRGLLELVAERGPDLVVVAGDLTQRAKPAQFRQAREWVDSMAAPVLAVPGNHDVPMYRFWERLFVPFGAYRKHYDPDLEPVYEDGEMFVLGINSAHNWTIKDGRVSRRRIDEVEARFAAAPPGKLRVAVVHHELIPAPRFGSQKVLANAEPLVAALDRAGVRLVLSGHLHQAFCDLAESYYPGLGRDLVIVHSGTTTSSRGRGCERGRNTGHWIELDAGVVRVRRIEWEPAAGRFVETGNREQPALPVGGEPAVR